MRDYDNEDDATHVAKYIEYSPDIKITGVETKNLFKHAELCKYKIYELTDKFREEAILFITAVLTELPDCLYS